MPPEPHQPGSGCRVPRAKSCLCAFLVAKALRAILLVRNRYQPLSAVIERQKTTVTKIWKLKRKEINSYINPHIYIYVYIYICTCYIYIYKHDNIYCIKYDIVKVLRAMPLEPAPAKLQLPRAACQILLMRILGCEGTCAQSCFSRYQLLPNVIERWPNFTKIWKMWKYKEDGKEKEWTDI